jgi:hypothetical protein
LKPMSTTRFSARTWAQLINSHRSLCFAEHGACFTFRLVKTCGAAFLTRIASTASAANNSKPGASNVAPSFQWDQNAYPGVAIQAAKNPNANDFGWGQSYATPNSLNLGRTQNWNLGFEYGLNTNTVLDVRYVGNVGYDLHDGGLYPENFPTWSQYYPLLMSGHAGDSISTQSEAVAAGVPWYPFLPAMAGGCGSYSAESAISPQPQTDACWGSSLRVAGNPRGNSGYNGVVAEIKKRAGNGLSMDLSYTMSKAVGNVIGVNQVDEWYLGSAFQDPYSYGQFKNMVSPGDIRNQVKGFVSYNLPFGRNGHWLQGSRKLDYIVGGWTTSGDVNYHSPARRWPLSELPTAIRDGRRRSPT